VNKDQALDKIRKLLATTGRTDHERDTAQVLAAAIAEKHGIDIAEVDRIDQAREVVITHRSFGEWATEPPEALYAALICNRFFEVTSFNQVKWTESRIVVGTENHLLVAEYVFKYLLHEFRWQWNHRRGRCKKRKQFIYGCFIALCQKLDERFAQPSQDTAALEVNWLAKRKKYIEENFGKLSTSSAAPKSKGMALQRGFIAGQDIDIRPGVAAGQSPKAAQLAGPSQRLLGL